MKLKVILLTASLAATACQATIEPSSFVLNPQLYALKTKLSYLRSTGDMPFSAVLPRSKNETLLQWMERTKHKHTTLSQSFNATPDKKKTQLQAVEIALLQDLEANIFQKYTEEQEALEQQERQVAHERALEEQRRQAIQEEQERQAAHEKALKEQEAAQQALEEEERKIAIRVQLALQEEQKKRELVQREQLLNITARSLVATAIKDAQKELTAAQKSSN